MKRTRVKWFVGSALLLIALAAAGWYVKAQRNGAIKFTTAPVTRGELVQAVTATGTLNPVTNVQVGCQISGIIEKLFVDYNSPVTNGQVIAQLDPATYRANMLQAEGDLANAKAALRLAQVNAARAKDLFDGRLIPQSDYDQATANLSQAEANVKVKEAAIEKTRVDLERCTIYSPVDGIVISRSIDVGQTVAASLNAPTLFVIANDLTKMQIDANVAEADIGGIQEGQNVDFTVDAFPNQTFHGTVKQVRNAPITVQNVVTYDTVIGVSNPDLKLRPGMTANVSIIVAQRDDALKIPNSALRFRMPESTTSTPSTSAPPVQVANRPSGGVGSRGGGRPRGARNPSRTVYIIDVAGKPQQREIKLGISDGIYTEVREGLQEGANVIVSATGGATGARSQQPQSPFGPGFRRF